jgi:formylmethanofuran dehydrogenase subunit D
MAVIAKINTGSNIGQVKLTQQTRSTIAAQNFKPKPNVALTELTDVSAVGVQDGDALIYDSATGKYIVQTIQAFVTEVNGGQF